MSNTPSKIIFCDQKIITCILPKDKAKLALKILCRDYGINAIDIHYARGSGRITPLQHRGIGETSEKDVLTVAVPAEKSDEMFEHIYELTEINRPHGGLMYMQALKTSTYFTLPKNLPEEE